MTTSVLVGCEYSGTVRDAFLERGWDAWSCDLEPTERHPQFHMQCDIGLAITSRPYWDLIILHVPCTALANCGNKHYGRGKPKHHERVSAIIWTLEVWKLACEYSDHVVLENPASVIFPVLRKGGADAQFIHPWQHGHPEQKTTGLALRGLPRLVETNNVYEEMMKLPKRERERIFHMKPGPDRGKERARFYPGFAEAMADQWGSYISGDRSIPAPDLFTSRRRGMSDLLRMDYINSLPQPFVGRFCGGDEWPIHDIDVETGLLRIAVSGLLQVKHIGEALAFRDANGAIHDADDFYAEAASGMEAPSGGETVQQGSTEGDSPAAESRDAQEPSA